MSKGAGGTQVSRANGAVGCGSSGEQARLPAAASHVYDGTAMPDQNEERQRAAEAAVNLVEDGMVVGLGTGGTAAFAIRLLAKRCQDGLAITGIPTSTRSAALAV